MRSFFLYAGIALVAGSGLALEILLTRITSVIAWYHLSFFVIALAMLGMTAGAIYVFMRPGLFGQAVLARRLARSSAAFAALAPLAVAWAMSGPLLPVTDLMGFFALLGFGAALAVPFAAAGVALTLALTRMGLPAGRAYGCDLLGAAAGCGLVIPLLDVVDAASAVLVVGAIAALGALAFATCDEDPGERRRSLGTCGALALALLAFAGLNAAADAPPLRPAWVKGVREDPREFMHVAWNTHSRVTVSNQIALPPYLWAPGRNMPPEARLPIQQRVLKIDGAAATLMAEGAASDHAYLDWDLSTFAHRLRPSGPAAVIGVGGGRDVLAALRSGHSPVVGVELNAAIVDLHRRTMADFSTIASRPGVELHTDEARSFFSRDRRQYQVITMSLIDTWASTGAGAYSLSENGLYTVEGWLVFLRRLAPEGVFTVSRWYKKESPGETARMLALAMEALWQLGVDKPRAHLLLLQAESVATLLVSPSPFSAADLDAMQREAVRLGFNMVLTPRRLPAQPLLAELGAIDERAALWQWAERQTLDLTPPTDDRPFFFNMLKPGTWLEGQEEVSDLDLGFLGNLQATQTLVYATLVSLLLTLAALLGPLLGRSPATVEAEGPKQASRTGLAPATLAAALAYFALIGLGFMFVEIALLSQVGVFVGHPTLSLAVVLGGIILAAGVGSLISGKLNVERGGAAAWLFPLIPALLVVAARVATGPVTDGFAGADTSVRVLLSIALIAPPALGMGSCFPLGLRLVERAGGHAVTPWLWGINGAFGVCASGLALGTSMTWGISTTMAVGAGCYLALVACARQLARARA
ncbi:hypothetical protein [Nannocystis radixulma]|uniref:Spermidine synthase n=1 Tax=Nannocystis radixulma TaxID=2995305 RepID=A0ABT5B0V2_9BACT|nr:hypothetical protein [Nannocystis radixulma]MDC0667139.1 hypothetical protein [Nannocystis radixulma]